MDDLDSEWRRKGATLSHKTAEEEFGLTWEDIVRAIRAGKLHYREHSMYGNPWLRLLRREVEALVKERHGAIYLKDRQAKTELARINRELKRLKRQTAALEERKSKLIAGSGK
jgi:hypothetical protein